jgi:Zn-finger nucleic acid-binding protein
MKCPVDGNTLALAERNGIEIDYCPECRGVWLDRGELDRIIERAAPAGRGGYDERREHDERRHHHDHDHDDRHRDDRYHDDRHRDHDDHDRSARSRRGGLAGLAGLFGGED